MDKDYDNEIDGLKFERWLRSWDEKSVNTDTRMVSIENDTYKSWNPTRIDAFIAAVEYVFDRFSYESRLSWDRTRGLEGQPVLKMTVHTKDWGHISTSIPVEAIESKNAPKNLPEQLLKSFEAQFEKKKKRLVKREWEEKKRERQKGRTGK